MTSRVKISKVNLGQCNIYWIELPGAVQLGISGYRNIPGQVLTVKAWFNGVNRLGESQVLLFPTLPEGRPFLAAMGAADSDYGSIFMKRKVARSRYTILSSEVNPDRYLLLYTSLISGQALTFFLDFFEQMKLASRGVDRMTARGAQITTNVFKAYTVKLGFDFVSPSDDLQKARLRVAVGNWSTFIDSKVFRALGNSKNVDVAVSFMVEKVDTAFFMIDWKMVEWFTEVFNILATYTRVLTTIKSMHGIGNIEPLLLQKFQEHNTKTRTRLRKHPDFLRALDHIASHTKGVDSTTSYAGYIQNTETRFCCVFCDR